MLLDDDVVVRKDLAGLWEQDLDGNIIGAVGAHEGSGVCVDKTFGDHLNFSVARNARGRGASASSTSTRGDEQTLPRHTSSGYKRQVPCPDS
jgi:hypothetical protein